MFVVDSHIKSAFLSMHKVAIHKTWRKHDAKVVMDDVTLKKMWLYRLNMQPQLDKSKSSKFFINREGGGIIRPND